MKIILTGATGFVGGELLKTLLANHKVEKVTCLTRRPLDTTHAKLTVLLCDDFSQLNDGMPDELCDHDACIWAVGAKASDTKDVKMLKRVTYDLTLAFANAILPHLTHPFCFCYLSGMGADPSETARFPWEKNTRHLKGRTEKALQMLSTQNPNFTSVSFRPAGILPENSGKWARILLAPIVIGVEQLSTAMVGVALNPPPGLPSPLSNAQIKSLSNADS